MRFYAILREKCQYSEFSWSLFSRILAEYQEIWSISTYSVRMRENKDQKNCKYDQYSCGVILHQCTVILLMLRHFNFIPNPVEQTNG